MRSSLHPGNQVKTLPRLINGSPFITSQTQWGVVTAVNYTPVCSVDVALDGVKHLKKATGGSAYTSTKMDSKDIRVLGPYHPRVGDTVLVVRGIAGGSTTRVVVGNLQGGTNSVPVYIGTTTTHPVTGVWFKGALYLATGTTRYLWVCTQSGEPGTWVKVA